jgi:hypothetical protein
MGNNKISGMENDIQYEAVLSHILPQRNPDPEFVNRLKTRLVTAPSVELDSQPSNKDVFIQASIALFAIAGILGFIWKITQKRENT